MPMHSVARLDDLRSDRATQVQIGKQKILLIRVAHEVRAFQGECPHAGAPLAEGALCAGKIICPWHKAAFAIEDGALCEPPALDGLRRYPVQLREGVVWVDDQASDSTTIALRSDPRTFVVVGAGAAGTAAACALRDQGFGGRLVLIDREPAAGYDRTALSKFVLAGQMKADEVPSLRESDYWSRRRVERFDKQVSRLQVGQRQIVFSDGTTLSYDAALLATGGAPRSLPLAGAQLAKVFLLRSLDQARAVIEAAPREGHAVVIGNSFIAMEAAAALCTLGMQVTVLARSPVPFEKQFGTEVGHAVRRLHEQHGVLYRTDVQALGFSGEQQVEAVELDNGERLPVDLVLLGVGVAPVTSFIEGLNLAEDGAVPVDSHLRAADGLWAAGDIAQFPRAGQPIRIEHWRLAQQQGRLAAHNMLGGDAPFFDVPFFWTFHFGKRLDYLGQAGHWQETYVEGQINDFSFVALLIDEDQVQAVVACQRERLMALLAERMRRPLGRGEALQLLAATQHAEP